MPSKKKVKKEPDRVLIAGQPHHDQCDNKVVSARYTPWSFFPVAIGEQFRRFANVYFLVVGIIMLIGQYTDLYDTAISPWTTLGPLAVVISISLLVEGFSDYKRHQNDHETNNANCVILRRADEMQAEIDEGNNDQPIERDPHICHGKDVAVNMNKTYYRDSGQGKSTHTPPPPPPASSVSSQQGDDADMVKVAFQKIRRKDIRQGHLVLVKNREMAPADCVLLASSNDQGGAYIETSSIDGETNLKLRNSPHLPQSVIDALRQGNPVLDSITEEIQQEKEAPPDENAPKQIETIEGATRRIAQFSYLGQGANSVSVLEHPSIQKKNQNNTGVTAPASSDDIVKNGDENNNADEEEDWGGRKKKKIGEKVRDSINKNVDNIRRSNSLPQDILNNDGSENADGAGYVATLTCEPPNASVHTFSGKLTLPPIGDSSCFEIPLGAENVLLRGAVIRNTEWVIGLAFFTGTDTKLVRNSFDTPSKFSQLDRLINKTVLFILFIMLICIFVLASQAVVANKGAFDTLWYAGFNTNSSEPWPYFANTDAEALPPPAWDTRSTNWIQYFLLYVTLLNNFIPLSLYVSVEMVQFCMLWFIYADLEMYDDTTDTRASARSTIVSDLGRIEYIFSDKTGTLTQNVMRFKRCSVDGMIFGAPIQRTRPGLEDSDESTSRFHPLRQLLVGRFKSPSELTGLEGLGGTSGVDASASQQATESDSKLTFNSEMFLRVMSLCHTVVVEKDIDKKADIGASETTTATPKGSSVGSYAKNLFKGRKRADTGASIDTPNGSVGNGSALSDFDAASPPTAPIGGSTPSNALTSTKERDIDEMGKMADGAPMGYAYQAESPDEGALVSAASSTYGFQVVTRDTSGIRLRCEYPSHLQDAAVTSGLQSGSLTLDRISAETAHVIPDDNGDWAGTLSLPPVTSFHTASAENCREEVWSILAVNKFDSDRKRMSILLRSPPELGNLPILFCKGADSSMIDPEICGKSALLAQGGNDAPKLKTVSEDDEDSDADAEDIDMAQMLGMQVHLGEFAKEGLRTLVLGIRVLTEKECTEWLDIYNAAATSMKNRDALLTEAAKMIETNLHIVGATAIEDKLQRNVPQTIATLGKAGIKLWVLTGDKRETAVEIGYSTNVLTSKMHLTEVPDKGKAYVRTQMAMEFIRLIKIGRLQEYQMAALGDPNASKRYTLYDFLFALRRWKRSFRRSMMRFVATIMMILGMQDRAEEKLETVQELLLAEKKIVKDTDRRRKVRERADMTIKAWLKSDAGANSRRRAPEEADPVDNPDLTLASEETPLVFVRAASAQGILNDMGNSGELSQPELRQLSIAHLTAHQAGLAEATDSDDFIVDEDTLSLESFVPGSAGDTRNDFDKKKRTLLERMFAVDRTVRKGRLRKHVKKQRLREIAEQKANPPSVEEEIDANNRNALRALVIEGAALKHLLGDPEFEEILFSVASNCNAVIACRVSPRQKALLVGLVRQNVRPEPVTLAIGDGANDVGMIQEAHVGIGISGKEGKQAVNASDFAIAQFRFLEDLTLIHGRWDFFRLSIVAMFSFYKNAVMAGTIMIFTERSLYSGTPLYDEWILAMLNFVAAFPIIFTGLFDRCLSKVYVKKHPEVYNATRENQLITLRVLFRWILVCVMHVFILYYFTVPQQSYGGGVTSAFKGLMQYSDNTDVPGDGEGGDLKSVGTVTFTCMIFLLAYKVLFETRSLVHGIWPAFTCRKDVGEGWASRLAYTWISVTWLSIIFYLFAICTYQLVGRNGASQFSGFVLTTNHVLGSRSISWMIILFMPVIAMVFDVCGKVFSNMFYPTQTQIHLERESMAKQMARRRRPRPPVSSSPSGNDTNVRLRHQASRSTENV